MKLPAHTDVRSRLDEALHIRIARNLLGEYQFPTQELRLSETSQCERLRAAKSAGLIPPSLPDKRAGSYFERGRIAENWVEQVLRDYGVRVRREVPVNHPYGHGHIDMVVPSWRTLIEIKSATADADGTIADLPKLNHIAQLQSYLWFYGRQRHQQYRGLLLYVMFGAFVDWRIYPVVCTPQRGKEIAQEFHRLHTAVETGELPQVSPKMSPYAFPCTFRTRRGDAGRCPLYDLCWGQLPLKKPAAPADDPEMRRLVEEFTALADQPGSVAKAAADDFRKALVAQMSLRGLTEIATQDGGILRLSTTKPRRTVNLPAALAAGVIDAATLEPFTSYSGDDSALRLTYRRPQDLLPDTKVVVSDN